MKVGRFSNYMVKFWSPLHACVCSFNLLDAVEVSDVENLLYELFYHIQPIQNESLIFSVFSYLVLDVQPNYLYCQIGIRNEMFANT